MAYPCIDKDGVLQPWFDVKSAVAYTLGRTMIHWSRNAMGYPTKYGEEWTALLYMHGCALKRYGDHERGLLDLYEFGTDLFPWKYECDVAAAEAKHAMMWLVDNFEYLWD